MQNFVKNDNDNFIPYGLKNIHNKLISKDWKMRINIDGFIVYSQDKEMFDEFRIKLDEKSIQVSVPLPNSEYLYKCRFNNYFEASEFIEQHLHNYELSKKTQSLYEDIKGKNNSSKQKFDKT